MKKLKRLFFILGAFLGLTLIGGIVFLALKPKVAGIFVDATPKSEVFIDERDVGSTPYKVTHAPGEIILKVVPQDEKMAAYETRIALLPSVETVVRRYFGPTDETSHG